MTNPVSNDFKILAVFDVMLNFKYDDVFIQFFDKENVSVNKNNTTHHFFIKNTNKVYNDVVNNIDAIDRKLKIHCNAHAFILNQCVVVEYID